MIISYACCELFRFVDYSIFHTNSSCVFVHSFVQVTQRDHEHYCHLLVFTLFVFATSRNCTNRNGQKRHYLEMYWRQWGIKYVVGQWGNKVLKQSGNE